MTNHKSPESELAWQLADYRAHQVEAPARCVSHPDSSEGELMSDDEIDELIKDSIATLRILADHRSERFESVLAAFKADLAYLATLGRISDDDYNELTHPDNLQF